MNRKGEFRINGLTILGICLIVVSIFSIVYGATLYPFNFLNSNFMSFVVGGVLSITIGMCIISGMPNESKLVAVWISALSLMVYVYGFEMELILTLMSFVPIVGLALWITTKLFK